MISIPETNAPHIGRLQPKDRWWCCDRKARAACAQSFALWQEATIEITRRYHTKEVTQQDHSIGIALVLLVHATYAGPGKALGKPGNCPGPRAFGVLAFGYQNTPLVFHSFRLFTTRQNCRAFWLLRLVYRSKKLITLAFIVLSELKELNQTALRFL